MNPAPPVVCAPLEGTLLVEASAGTGKTWTIAGLYLRLVVELGLRCEQILVLTFTEAATAELRERIRHRLHQARVAAETGAGGDPLLEIVVERAAREPALAARLGNAIRGFDEAAIHTIHGFCNRVLDDNAFESGLPFDAELVPDDGDRLAEIAADFWRRELYSAPELYVRRVLARYPSPGALGTALRPFVAKPYLVRRGGEQRTDLQATCRVLERTWAELQALGADLAATLEPVLEHGDLDPSRYRRDHVRRWLDRLETLLGAGDPLALAGWDKLARFTPAVLEAHARGPVPEHPVFELCARLAGEAAALDRAALALDRRFLDYCDTELGLRKRRERRRAYDDLLVDLHGALHGSGGGALARRVRARYPAALIDEFQDTDPQQYAILRAIYAGTDAPFVMVGDPKQAIYGFRGADVFTYLQGASDAPQHATLAYNWRSSPALVQAFNTLFTRPPAPFLIEAIRCDPVYAAPREREALLIEGDASEPLVLWQLPAGGADRRLTVEAATQAAVDACTAEIVRLLDAARAGRARLGARALAGGDIAVLVRKHAQGRQVREALRAAGVATVEIGQENVFHSREAQELALFLHAAAEPARETVLRAALGTELAGLDAAAIAALACDEGAWQEWLERFHRYHQLWREHGIARMFAAAAVDLEVASRLLQYDDGERRLTNVRHVIELAQQHATEVRAGPEALLRWLARRRAAERLENDAQLLRLDSDAQLVRIVTVHKAKGLEYPIVFCPFLWDSPRTQDKGPFVWHDPQAHWQPVLELGSPERALALAQRRREDFAESLRLAYVSMTRAEQRCYVVWADTRDAARSPAAWFLFAPAQATAADAIEAQARHVAALDADAQRADLQALVREAGACIRIQEAPGRSAARLPAPGVTDAPLRARVARAPVPAPWRVTSFTALVAGAHGDALAETPDHDALAQTASEEAVQARGIFAFPRGARAGSCLHAVLERLDFAGAEDGLVDAVVARELERWGFEHHWHAAIGAHVRKVIATPLAPAGLRLADLDRAHRLDELEFHYPIASVHERALRALFDDAALPWPEGVRRASRALTFAPVHGYLKGYIDLVFEAGGRWYLADYKSNWLGAEIDAYARECLAPVMAREHYYLQYLLYLVALHRYLGRRLPGYDYDVHMGGAYYLFLRGMDPARGPACGVFHERPPRALIEALDGLLRGERP